MTFDDYLELRKKEKRLTWGDVTYLLEKEDKYRHRFISTFVPIGQGCWMGRHRKEEHPTQKILELYREKVPEHFAYIKFYKTARSEGPFALVAGKTNLGNPDFDFKFHLVGPDDRELDEMEKDRAKHFLLRTDGSWYCQGVLAFWLLEAEKEDDEAKVKKLAFSAEADIGGLLGLFKS